MSAIRNANGGYYPETMLQMALNEINRTYGHCCEIDRKSLDKYGNYDSVGTSEVDIGFNGYDLVHSSTNSIDTISSSDNSDTQTITIEGMTISGSALTFVKQTKTLTGQTKATLDTPLSRCTRIQNLSSATPTAGNVYVYEDGTISGGVPVDTSTIGNVMVATDQSTLFAGTSVASNNYFIMLGWWATVNKKTTATADVRLKWRTVGGVYVTRQKRGINQSSACDHTFAGGYRIVPPNSDIDITAVASTTGVDISAGFYGVFADIVS